MAIKIKSIKLSRVIFHRSSFNFVLLGKYLMFIVIVAAWALHVKYWLWPKPYSDFVEYARSTIEQHQNLVRKFFEPRKEWATSNLGTCLFKHPSITSFRMNAVLSNKTAERFYNVLIWKHWNWLRHRHTDGFRDYQYDPLYICSVSNCRFYGDTDLSFADAVVVHIQKGLIPDVTRRNPHQLWIFWLDESPKHALSLSNKRPNSTEFANVFNWSMTYRTDSDVPIPYGRTLPLLNPMFNELTAESLKDLVPFWKEKERDVLAAILVSNCIPSRMSLLSELKKYMQIDVYGKCAKDADRKNKCPGHFRSECKIISKYLFYIVMENSKCKQYLSEKSFHHAYGKGAIPVFVGTFLEDCNTLLPPNSYLHIENYKTPQDLAAEIISISNNLTKLLSYHAWRNHFKVENEHGYFGTRSSQMCRICEALNYNERSQKVYGLSDIQRFIDPKMECSSNVNAIPFTRYVGIR